jgi:hypothetical protein
MSKHLNTEQLNQQRTGKDLGVTMGTLDWRHAAVGIGWRFVGDEFARGYRAEIEEVEEPEVETDDPLDISAGPGSAIGVNRYAVPSDIVKHLSKKNIQTFRPLSESWHRFLGLESRSRGADVEGEVADIDTDADVDEHTPPAKRQRTARQTTTTGLATPVSSDTVDHTSRAWPARTPSSVHSSSPSLPFSRSFRTRTPAITSTPATHSDGIFLSSPSLSRRRPDTTMAVPSSPPPLSSAVFGPSEDDITRAVRKALNQPDGGRVTYRSAEQEAALQRIVEGRDPTLAVVLPTGGGKTLLFTAFACLDDPGMTVVVIRYRRLMDETVEDARALKIDCLEWTYRVEDPATTVFVSADRLCGSFLDYASRMHSKGLLRRIYIDECHLAITAHSWRPKVAKLSQLRGIGAPLIIAASTLHSQRPFLIVPGPGTKRS